MIKIPKEVVTAFRNAWMDADKTTEAALAEALNAWPGRSIITGVSSADAFGNHHPIHPMTLHLPLPQEKNDD